MTLIKGMVRKILLKGAGAITVSTGNIVMGERD